MRDNENWPFNDHSKVMGMPLPDYLAWAAGKSDDCHKKLFLPPIQRGFVWKPVQIAQLWDSLLRGMPIGSLMVSKLAAGQKVTEVGVKNRATEAVTAPAIALLDGQQRTLAMLLGWEGGPESDHCVWVDLGEPGSGGSPFELRISTRTQPFGYQRDSHGKLSRHERREARKQYDEASGNSFKELQDFKLFEQVPAPRPWKGGKDASLCFPLKALWAAFRAGGTDGGMDSLKRCVTELAKSSEKPVLPSSLEKLGQAFERLAKLEVPLILVPEHISQPSEEEVQGQKDAPAPLTLLFERIGQNGARLSTDDLLFSMIKQQWPEAHDLVEKLHKGKAGYLMSATDFVMTAYRLAMAEDKKNDAPRPTAGDFHRHLGELVQEGGTLRRYLLEGTLPQAFDDLYRTLKYRGSDDCGLPDLMLTHFSRGLIQVLLRWFMLNPGQAVQDDNRPNILAFTLFWYLHIWHEDKASKSAFGLMEKGAFPAQVAYCKLIAAPVGETGLALPLVSFDSLKSILILTQSPLLRNVEEQFIKESTWHQRELYKRFCWWRKPVLLWLQRAYVQRETEDSWGNGFAGLTDEDAVPYDYDHLCPQNHWGADWRKIGYDPALTEVVGKQFYKGRYDVGNCIGNLHVLDSSLNRSFGDDPLTNKLHSGKWQPKDSLLPLDDKLWREASPELSDENQKWRWDEHRLQAFQTAVQDRALALYRQYFEACQVLLREPCQPS